MINAQKFERSAPVRNIRENFVYTIKGFKLEDITCDDNGAYQKHRTAKRSYHVTFQGDSSVKVSTVYKHGDEYIANERNGRQYRSVKVPTDEVYELERYYRDSKNFEGLRQMVAKLKCAGKRDYEDYTCVVFSRTSIGTVNEEENMLPHGNAIHTGHPYIRTSRDQLDRQDELLTNNSPFEVYEQLVGESSSSSSQSYEPRNSKQLYNRSYNSKKTAEVLFLYKPINRSSIYSISSFSYTPIPEI